MAVLARHSARFDVLQVQFDPISGKHLAVAGLRTLQVRSQPLIIPNMLLNTVPGVPNAPGWLGALRLTHLPLYDDGARKEAAVATHQHSCLGQRRRQ